MEDLLGIKAAAQVCGVSQDTIKRRLRENRFPGAMRGPASGNRPGPWLIPRKDLRAGGLLADVDDGDSSAEVAELRVALAAKDALISAQSEHLADLRLELRWLRAVLAGNQSGAPDRDCALHGQRDLPRHGSQEEIHAG